MSQTNENMSAKRLFEVFFCDPRVMISINDTFIGTRIPEIDEWNDALNDDEVLFSLSDESEVGELMWTAADFRCAEIDLEGSGHTFVINDDVIHAYSMRPLNVLNPNKNKSIVIVNQNDSVTEIYLPEGLEDSNVKVCTADENGEEVSQVMVHKLSDAMLEKLNSIECKARSKTMESSMSL